MQNFNLILMMTFFSLDKPIISNIRNNTSDRPYPSDNIWLLGPEGGDFSLSFTVEAHPPVASNVSIVFSTGDPLPTITVTGSSVTLSFINLRRSNGGAYLVRVGNTIGYQDLPFYVYVDCKFMFTFKMYSSQMVLFLGIPI